MKYGLPYQGSKSRIADWVLSVLPASHTLVDLFAGGGAIVHAALLNGKYEHIIANDKTDSMMVFMEAATGGFEGFSTVVTREEFNASDDTAIKILYSFGNGGSSYLWSDDLAAFKVPAAKMISAPSLHERRIAYRTFCRELVKFLHIGDDSMRLQPIECLANMQNLEALERLEALEGDYRLVKIPEGATVYADPPYRGTECGLYADFDVDAFDAWLGGVDFPVYVSEYTCPPGCVEIAHTEHYSSLPSDRNSRTVERIFVQERFADQYQPDQPSLFRRHT